jgi:hypothetical protein
MSEYWTDIFHFQNYEASNFGNIRNKQTKRNVRSNLWASTGKYNIRMSVNGQVFTRDLSTVIFTSFNEEYNNISDYETRYKIILEHIDGNKSNNRYDNLKLKQ